MQIKPLTQATRADVRAMAQAAANRDEPLDTANVFGIGTVKRLQFMNDYHDQIEALGTSHGEFTEFEILVIKKV